jgi:8-oxo-dGTP pyrophosphatase MutT (NUDIX family)
LRDDPFEVLMVSRAARGAFASALVFPGGAIDPEDGDETWRDLVEDFDDSDTHERAVRIGAVREVWEETGILIGHATTPTRDGGSFREAVTTGGGRLRLGSLTHFGHWITPATEPRRFDTHFFLASAPNGQDAVPDGSETLTAEWLSPKQAVDLGQSGARPIIFPTLLNLARLAESSSSAEAIAAAKSRPRFTVQPEIIHDDDGRRRFTTPTEAGYPIREWYDTRP